MIPCGVRGRRPASASSRNANAELARLLLDGKYSPEQAPVDPVSGQQVSLRVGSEQRVDELRQELAVARIVRVVLVK